MKAVPKDEITLFGIPASPGVAHGQVFRFLHEEVEVLNYEVKEEDHPKEIARFKEALNITYEQIQEIREGVAKNLGEKEAGIFDAHLMVLEDKALIDDVEKEIRTTGDNVEQCLHRVTQRYYDYFNQLEDVYLRERASDLKDISRRLIRNLIGATAAGTAFLSDPRVLVSEDLTPSDTASLDRSKIIALATETGGQTSHAVIMARASSVPAVVGVRSLIEGLKEGDTLLVDGFEGLVIINPSETTLFRYGKVGIRRKRLNDLVEEDADEPALTKDGHPVQLFANADSPEEVISGINSSCEGVGLFRTEALFLRKNEMPSEDVQFSNYRELVETANPLSVTIRTLDLGGDKVLNLSGREKENNPFMGFRAIRYCLQNPEIFIRQLRAILRASAYGKIKLLFPMVSGVGEVIRAKVLLNRAKDELTEQKVKFDETIEIGCMIETPSAVTICDLLAKEVDFFSVGTNDLVQYLLAVDRVNNQIAYLYEPHHPAVIRSLQHVSKVAQNSGRPITVCGEIAGDPHFLPLLLGLGLNHLSCAPPLLKELKFFARRFTQSECEALVDEVLSMARPIQIKERLKDFYDYRVANFLD
ncbi:MAG: phosphoenolpyruvate--protein phosphotransferase [Verrucomicrobiota bacterium]|nr:phosphoenolpyruvate--protein phosphotransferase [Verrucomicrobiota bacterium]